VIRYVEWTDHVAGKYYFNASAKLFSTYLNDIHHYTRKIFPSFIIHITTQATGARVPLHRPTKE
jgi:hypothetical protein